MELRYPTAVTVRDPSGERERGLVELVRNLAEVEARPFRVLSLTLDVRWRDEHQRERVRLFLKDQARMVRNAATGEAKVKEALGRDLERAEAIVEDHIRRSTAGRGLALYLCEQVGLGLEVDSWWPLPARLVAGPWPALRPLFEGLRDPGRALVVVTDTRSTRVYQLTGAGPDLAAQVEREVPRRHSRGGWSQHRVQWHRSEQIDAHHREAVGELTRLFDEQASPHVIIGGRIEAVGNLERMLPARLAERAVRVEAIDPALPEDELGEAVREALDDVLLEDGIGRVRDLEGLAALGRGAIDVPGVVAALNEQRVDSLLVSPRFCAEGYTCPRCNAVGEGAEAICPDCGEAVEPMELGEAMIRRAILQGADVETLDPATGLDRRGGVAAELRYPTMH